MTTKTIDADKLGLKPIKVNQSLGMQQKVGIFQKEISKISLDNQTELTSAVRDANIVSHLNKDKAEDQRTMKRIADKYGVDLGPFDVNMWEFYDQALANLLTDKVVTISSGNSAEASLKIAMKKLQFIEDLAGITSKREKEKLENSDKFTTEDVAELTGKLIQAIMGTEGEEPTKEDTKSKP